MDLTKITSASKNLQEPKLLHFIYGGPKITFWGIYSNTSYRAGDGDVVEVDERDVEYLLSIEKHGERYFAIAEGDNGITTIVKEKTVTTAIAETHKRKVNYKVGIDDSVNEDFNIVTDLVDAPYDYFDIIDGISETLANKIHELGVHDFYDLHNKGIEWIADLPRVSKQKANKIYKQLEEIIGEYE